MPISDFLEECSYTPPKGRPPHVFRDPTNGDLVVTTPDGQKTCQIGETLNIHIDMHSCYFTVGE